MARRKTEEPGTTEEADLMAVVEATDPKADDPAMVESVEATERPTATEVKAEAPIAPPPPAPPASSRAGMAFLGMVLGGVIAAGAGFGLARVMPDLLPLGEDPSLAEMMAQQGAKIAALEEELAFRPDLEEIVARLAALEAAPTPASAVETEGEVATLRAAVAELQARPAASGGGDPALAEEVALLREQVANLGAGGGVPADVVAAVDAAEARLKEAEERAAALAREAEATAVAARRAAATERLAAALDSGAPFASALTELGSEIPAVLAENAAVGLPTIADLSDAFPDTARQSLEDALRANMGESWTDRVSNFLRSQTGLRSLTPREGNDPDAVLSRAEAALQAGDVARAITELSAMPEAGKPALADWLAMAQTRADAEAAVAALAQN
ncbi:COG4223 family protein [Tabrizicola sp. M-4]|uniref:COG4223 family protein n=1 Tax=Tabrizicola sp. M-4 TaxID=3055847 RepID=UPI003DA8D42D